MEGSELELFERSLRHAVEASTASGLDAALEQLGWRDALSLDPRSSISILFVLQGLYNVVSSALNEILLSAISADTSECAVVLPAFGDWRPPGLFDGGDLVVSGLSTGRGSGATHAAIVAHDGQRHVVATVPFDALTVRPIRGMDPGFGLSEVRGTLSGVEVHSADWSTALALGQLAVSHELVGASRKMLDLAREHALNRIQFGQPISRFQAVRHRLADTLVAIETADAMLDAAWIDRESETAAIAKALAGRGARIASRHCQQVLAGIGFTAEHPFHRYLRRILVLDGILGSSRLLTTEFGRHLLETRHLPDLLPL